MSLYHEAAEILSSSSSEGGSLKSRVFGKKGIKSPPNQLYALVLESCKWSLVLKDVIEGSEILKHERKLTPVLSLLLVHDLLLARSGVALPQSHGLRMCVDRHKGRLTSELTRARLRRKAESMDILKEEIERASAGEEANYPRWVRINVLKTNLEEQLEATFSAYSRATSISDVIASTPQKKQIYIDPHVPNLVAVTAGTDLTKTRAYTSGQIILQDKASCFPAYLLDPRSEDGDVMDACAAPGNKTTHLAAILYGHQPEFESAPQIIYACEKDSRRAQTLEKMVKTAGSKTMTRIAFGQDFLQVDPDSEKFQDVGALLLDPSCSGSGIVGRDSMPELHLPEAPGGGQIKAKPGAKAKDASSANNRKRKHAAVKEPAQDVMIDDDGNETAVKSEKDLQSRLEALASFQLELLLHAFQFPAAKKITYSTCSIHSQENEGVVMLALKSEVARTRGWRILVRQDQVSGMREWPVRGLVEPCEGHEEVADACIRSYKDDGQGVMGFFVAGFVRSGDVGGVGKAAAGDDDGPYVRDEEGKIVRDMMGMPVLRSTGLPVALEGREEAVVSVVREEDGDDDVSSGDVEDDEDGENEEWGGFE